MFTYANLNSGGLITDLDTRKPGKHTISQISDMPSHQSAIFALLLLSHQSEEILSFRMVVWAEFVPSRFPIGFLSALRSKQPF